MSDIICVTNRALCPGDFLQQIEAIAKAAPAAIILREKDLTAIEYERLAKQVLAICRKHDVRCILHSFVDSAIWLRATAIHLPLPILRDMLPEEKAKFTLIGASCHSVREAIEAEKLGCSYVTAGHVFATDCKKGLPPRGTSFLQEVCDAVSIPVYAIGGNTPANMAEIRETHAVGACVMSGLMRCADPKEFLESFDSGKDLNYEV